MPIPLIRNFIAWRRYRAAIVHLDGLDDRLLADLGTTRAEIARFPAGPDPRWPRARVAPACSHPTSTRPECAA